MARDDGMRYGAGGAGMIQEIQEIAPVNPDPTPKGPLASRGRPKKKDEAEKLLQHLEGVEVQMLEETVRDSLPSDVE